MRKFRTLAVVTALAAVALLVPSTAQAGAPGQDGGTTVTQNGWSWRP